MSTATVGVGSYPGSPVPPDNYDCCRFQVPVAFGYCNILAAGVE